MNHKRLWIAASIIAFVIFISFMLSVPHTKDIEEKTLSKKSAQITPTVVVHDLFKKGVHTITGTVEVPNQCTSITAGASLQSTASSTGNIVVAISTTADSGVCLELPAHPTFQTSITAPANIPILVTVDGGDATTNAP